MPWPNGSVLAANDAPILIARESRGEVPCEDWLPRISRRVAADLPGGQAAVDYTAPVPIAAARAQHFYGLAETPKLAGGRVPLRLSLLSPAGRPIALTADIAGFWRGAWADARRDMRGRYPRHNWPENPLQP